MTEWEKRWARIAARSRVKPHLYSSGMQRRWLCCLEGLEGCSEPTPREAYDRLRNSLGKLKAWKHLVARFG